MRCQPAKERKANLSFELPSCSISSWARNPHGSPGRVWTGAISLVSEICMAVQTSATPLFTPSTAPKCVSSPSSSSSSSYPRCLAATPQPGSDSTQCPWGLTNYRRPSPRPCSLSSHSMCLHVPWCYSYNQIYTWLWVWPPKHRNLRLSLLKEDGFEWRADEDYSSIFFHVSVICILSDVSVTAERWAIISRLGEQRNTCNVTAFGYRKS